MASNGERSDPKIGCDQSPEVQLNLNVRGLSTSATVAINERSDQLRDQGRQIFKMGAPVGIGNRIRTRLHEFMLKQTPAE